MKTDCHSPACIARNPVALLCFFALFASWLKAPAQEHSVAMNAAEFQRVVYSAHLLTSLDEKPELDAGLQVLLELHRRNPQANPMDLVSVSKQALELYRRNAPPYIRKHGSRHEILAAYVDAMLQVPERTNFTSANLSLLNNLITRAEAPSGEPQADMIHSGSQSLLAAEGDLAQRQRLLDTCTARGKRNPGFGAAMDALVSQEASVSLGDSPEQIIDNSGSALHDSAAMQRLLGLSRDGGGSLTISSNELMTLFATEMQTFRDTIHTNLALQQEINQSQPDLLAYLANQPAIDSDAQRIAAAKQGESRRIASATAAVLVQSKLMEARDPLIKLPSQMRGMVEGLHKITDGLAAFGEKDPTRLGRIAASGNMLAGGLQLLDLFTGGESPEESIAREIGNVKTLLADLSSNMNYRFDRVDQSLTEIFSTLNERFDQVEIKLDAQGRMIAHLEGALDQVRFSLLGVQNDLFRVERNLATFHALDWRFDLVEDMNLGLGYEARVGSPIAFDQFIPSYVVMENVFFTHAFDRAATETLSRCTTLPFGDAHFYYQLSPGGATNVYGETLNYIRKCLRQRLGLASFPELPTLANPQDWSAGAAAWLQLAVENPGHFRRYPGSVNRLNGMISQGRQLTDFFRSLAFAGTNINWPLYDALKGFYVSKLVNFTNQVHAAEQQYASTTNFALDTWRQWDIAAPRVTATATAVLVGATVADSVADWSMSGVQGHNGWTYGYYDRSLDANGAYQAADFVAFPHDRRGYSPTDFWTGYSYDWYAGNPPWDEILQELGHPNSNNGGTVIPGNHGTHEHWVVRRWESTMDGDLKCRFRFRKTNTSCGDGVIGMIYRNGTLIYTRAIAGDDRVGRDDVVGLPGLRAGDKVDIMLAPGPLDHCDGSAFSATIFMGDPSANRWVTGGPARGHMAAGSAHSLMLKADGTVLAWGDNRHGEVSVPPDLTNVIALAAGYRHSLALKADGKVVAWGDNYYGAINVPAGLNNVVGLAGGTWYSLAAKADGTVVGWGDSRQGEIAIPAGLNNVVAVAAGENHSLALKGDGTVVAWGDNSYGQTSIPSGLWGVMAISAGYYHSLALGRDGRVIAWGDNKYGQVAVPIGANSNIVAIAASGFHSLALKSDGTVLAWGSNDSGQLNVPPGLKNAVAIAAGNFHSLALKSDGTCVAWGNNNYRQVIVPANAIDVVAWGETPAGLWQVPPVSSSITAVAAGSAHNLALTADGSVLAWGLNTWGQTNVPPQAQSGICAVACGLGHNLALGTNGSVIAWGLNDFGQTNVPALALSGIVEVGAGAKHSLALNTSGVIAAWGLNGAGQTTIPPDVQGKVLAIGAGGEHSLALTADGAVRAWGGNSSGQTNVPVEARTGIVAIAAGRYHNLVLQSGGRVVAWGLNSRGQCDVPVAAQSGVVAITAGITHSAALKPDGTVVVWGSGPAAFTSQSWNDVVAIAAGDQHSLLLKVSASPGTNALQTISFLRARIPVRLGPLLRGANDHVIAELERVGPLQIAGTELSGAKALLSAVLELGMPYTLERDDVLHGFLYGSESLIDLVSARSFCETENLNLLARSDSRPQVLMERAERRYLRFAERLEARLKDLAITGQPELPRLVDHTLRLLELLRQSWSAVPRPALELWIQANSLRLLLYGEPYAHYTLHCSDSLTAPNWTTVTNLHSEQEIGVGTVSSPRFYRASIPVSGAN